MGRYSNALKTITDAVGRLEEEFENRGRPPLEAFTLMVEDTTLVGKIADLCERVRPSGEDLTQLMDVKTLLAMGIKSAIASSGADEVNPDINPDNFPPDRFGEVGEGYVLAQPADRASWPAAAIALWLHQKRRDDGLEPATLADGCKYVKSISRMQAFYIVLWGSVSKSNQVPVLRIGGGRVTIAVLDDYDGRIYCKSDYFLFRKIKGK